jgi:hypothetical protein
VLPNVYTARSDNSNIRDASTIAKLRAQRFGLEKDFAPGGGLGWVPSSESPRKPGKVVRKTLRLTISEQRSSVGMLNNAGNPPSCRGWIPWRWRIDGQG